jgi:hypothetical protein
MQKYENRPKTAEFTSKKCAKKAFSTSKQGFECAPEKKTWKRKLNSLHIQDGPTKHACFMAIYMIVDLKTTLAKAKRAAAERHGVSMTKIEAVAKEVLGQDFFDRRNKSKGRRYAQPS